SRELRSVRLEADQLRAREDAILLSPDAPGSTEEGMNFLAHASQAGADSSVSEQHGSSDGVTLRACEPGIHVMKRLKLRLSRRSPAKLLELATHAAVCVTGNENFPDVQEEVDAVTTAAGDLAGTRKKIAKVEAVLRTLRGTHRGQAVVLREALDWLAKR